MQILLLRALTLLGVVLVAERAGAATIENGGTYTNDFAVRPVAADWSTRAIGSGSTGPGDFTTAAALDAAVQTNAFSRITGQLPSAGGTPPVNSLTALWSTNGYLQTRPNANAATLLMATFSNNTVTAATTVRIAYDYQTNRAPLVAEEVRGMRVYYSVGGAVDSWANIPELSQTGQGRLSLDVALASLWPPGSNLYLLWADDNGSGAPDDANNLDNFFLAIVDGVPDFSRVPPVVTQLHPPPGEVTAFDSLTVTFRESVTGVDAADLLVNDTPAHLLESSDDKIYTFSFAQPAFGPVTITWAADHGIADLDTPPKAFVGSTNQYTRVNPSAPVVAEPMPARNATVANLESVRVLFSEGVVGVDVADLLVNGVAAHGLIGSGADYTFNFTQPAYGPVAITWAAANGIQDTGGNAFDGTRATNRWNYTLVDNTPPIVLLRDPAAGSFVDNLAEVRVTFSEVVSGVNAGDLLVNGKPATSVSGAGATYNFVVPSVNGSVVHLAWATNHGIRDLSPAANPFDANAVGSTWSYSQPDRLAPIASISPPPNAIVRNLTRIAVTFDEPVTGVNATDLLINNVAAGGVSGAGAGPYIFTFSRPATGAVQVAFAPGHGIEDFGTPPNAFAGGAWSYTLDPAIATDIAVRHLVQISLDGLGAKYLENYVQVAPGQFPNFIRLMNESAFTMNARCDYDISETVPNHATMFTGRPVYQPSGHTNTTHHGYDNNFPTDLETLHNAGNLNVPYKSSMFDVAHDFGRTTAFYAGKTRLAVCERSYNETNGAPDTIGVGGDNGRDKIDFASVLNISGAAISNQVNSVLADLTNASPKHYTFIHIAEPDLTGHSQNWGTPGWSNAVRMVDAQLGRIIDAIDANPVLLNQTALIVTADHGGGGVARNGHTEAYHITNYTIPFFLRAPGIAGGTDLYGLFSNRADPGTNRTDYTTQPQPIRNGDGSNLALSLLALPPIPGSFMMPVFATPSVTLRVARFQEQVSVFWPDANDEFDLEMADSIAATQWQTVTNGISITDSTKTYTVTNATEASVFFRLLKK